MRLRADLQSRNFGKVDLHQENMLHCQLLVSVSGKLPVSVQFITSICYGLSSIQSVIARMGGCTSIVSGFADICALNFIFPLFIEELFVSEKS